VQLDREKILMRCAGIRHGVDCASRSGGSYFPGVFVEYRVNAHKVYNGVILASYLKISPRRDGNFAIVHRQTCV
jgi:hypothetical protein